MHPAAAKALFDAEGKHLSPALCARRGWVIHTLEFPVINVSYTAAGRTPLRLTYTCDNWNDLPPSIRLESPDGTPLAQISPNPTGVFHAGPHNVTKMPFICMRGSREYHTHESHLTDPWEPLRSETRHSIGGIMTQVWNAWLKGTG